MISQDRCRPQDTSQVYVTNERGRHYCDNEGYSRDRANCASSSFSPSGFNTDEPIRNSRRAGLSTLPEEFVGSSVAGHTAILRGTLKALRLARHLSSTWAHVSAALRVTGCCGPSVGRGVAAVTASLCVLTITAPTSWPRRASGTPTTAASRTPGSVRKKASTSDACT